MVPYLCTHSYQTNPFIQKTKHMPGFEFFGDEERKEVNDVLESGVLMRYGFDGMRNGHYKAKELEQDFAAAMGASYAQVVSNGTSALTVALACLGVGSGDEVIMPTFTFVASFEAILALGAIPVLCDVDDTLGLNPIAVENSITCKTKAIMPVHMCGSMSRLRELKHIADKHNIFLVEDACQAIGGTFEGKKLGTLGQVGCFSFDYVKTITAGEGGALITNDADIAEKAHMFQDHGHDHAGKDRGADKHPFLGYNYRISELNAAVAKAQLRKLDTIVAAQQQNHQILKEVLSSIPEVKFRVIPEGGVASDAFLNFFLPSAKLAQEVHRSLGANEVDACFYWFNNNWHYYRKWEHLIEQNALYPLNATQQEQLQQNNRTFQDSDYWISRTISCLIKGKWTPKETKQRAKKMKSVIKSVLAEHAETV